MLESRPLTTLRIEKRDRTSDKEFELLVGMLLLRLTDRLLPPSPLPAGDRSCTHNLSSLSTYMSTLSYRVSQKKVLLKGSFHKKFPSPKPHILDSNGVW